MRTNRSLAVWTVVLAGVMGVPAMGNAPAQPAGPEAREERRTPARITVNSRAEVSVQPDMAVLRLGAVAQDRNAGAAHERVSAIMAAAIERMRGLGLGDAEMSTAGITIHPVYANQRRPMDEPQEPRIVGYRASNTLRIELQDLAMVGRVIDAGVEAGANQFEGLSFELRDDSEARREALRRAVIEGRAKARTIADALEVRLGELHEVMEGGVGIVVPQFRDEMMARGLTAGATPTPVLPGQVRVEASVVMAYRIGEAR